MTIFFLVMKAVVICNFKSFSSKLRSKISCLGKVTNTKIMWVRTNPLNLEEVNKVGVMKLGI